MTTNNKGVTMPCPVCGAAMSDSICKGCGYVRIVFPQIVPESIARFETERVETMKKVLATAAEAQRSAAHAANQSKSRIGELTRKLVQGEEKVKSLQEDNEKHLKMIEAMLEENSTLQKEKEGLQTQLDRWKDEVEELKRRLSAAPKNALKGVVIIEDIRHDIRAAFPIYEGLNTYGANPDSGLHHQIKFHVRGYVFLPVHFSIQTSAKGIKIEAAPGLEFYQNGGLVRSAVYARQADNFVFGNNQVGINISPVI